MTRPVLLTLTADPVYRERFGESSNPSSATATLFNNGAATNLNTLNAAESIANAINAVGQVAGQDYFSGDPCSCFHAFLYSKGSASNIDNASLFPDGTIPYGINKSGDVVGQGLFSGSAYHAFLYSSGKMTDLDPFNGSQSIARSINDSGQIIGSHGSGTTWLYSNGTIADISGKYGASGYYIDNAGEIVGNLSNGHRALYSNGKWTDLGFYRGATTTAALGINVSGTIVGTAVFPTGITLTDATAINASGQIAADATVNGAKHVVLLTPQ